jgi:hypothetical protein
MDGFFDFNGSEVESQNWPPNASDASEKIIPKVSILGEALPTWLTIKKYRGEEKKLLVISFRYKNIILSY